VPTIVEKHEHGPKLEPGRDLQKTPHATDKAVAILLPGQIVQEDPQGIEA
jgi:redox-sensitive bicupin YhaK (pirin superfamily)